jgi:hypothetical protein
MLYFRPTVTLTNVSVAAFDVMVLAQPGASLRI